MATPAQDGRQPGPLTGIRVLEVTTMVAGPMSGQMLADLGAEVVKIEALEGDPMRGVRPMHKGVGALFMAMNRHKKSIALDLKSEKGQAIARKLALSADVLIENARPGVMARLGLSYDQLKADNPGLVYCSVSGFGPDGPYVSRPAFDQVLQAYTGVMHLQNPNGAPEPLKMMFVDKYTASQAASAITAALLFRERNGGQGQFVSVSLANAFSSFVLIDKLNNELFKEGTDRIPFINVTVPIRTKDGHMMGHIQTNDQFAKVCRALGRPELIEDPRFIGVTSRIMNIEAMWAELEQATKEMPTAELQELVVREALPLNRVNSVEDFLKDPQAIHNEAVVEIDDAEFGPMMFTNYPARFEKSPADVRARSPKTGEHTDQVLAGLGFGADEIAAARAEGYAA